MTLKILQPMVILEKSKSYLIAILMCVCFNSSVGQSRYVDSNRVQLIKDIDVTTYRASDTLRIIVKNSYGVSKSFFVEAQAYSIDGKYIYNPFYTASFNKDNVFFKKLNSNYRSASRTRKGYIVPDVIPVYLSIEPNAVREYALPVYKVRTSDCDVLRLKLVFDIFEDEKPVLYTSQFKICPLVPSKRNK